MYWYELVCRLACLNGSTPMIVHCCFVSSLIYAWPALYTWKVLTHHYDQHYILLSGFVHLVKPQSPLLQHSLCHLESLFCWKRHQTQVLLSHRSNWKVLVEASRRTVVYRLVKIRKWIWFEGDTVPVNCRRSDQELQVAYKVTTISGCFSVPCVFRQGYDVHYPVHRKF